MFRYLPGILLLQIVTVALGWASLNLGGDAGWWQWLIPAALLAVVTAFWFASIERAGSRAAMDKLRMDHAHERERLKVAVEKDKARIQEHATKTIRREERRQSRRANLKVGGAFAVTTLAGVLLLITELFTLGFMTITTTAGALGGYLFRWRQQRAAPDAIPDSTRIAQVPDHKAWIEGEPLSQADASDAQVVRERTVAGRLLAKPGDDSTREDHRGTAGNGRPDASTLPSGKPAGPDQSAD